MLAADVVVAQPHRLAQGELENLLGAGSERDVATNRVGPLRHTLIYKAFNDRGIDPEAVQNLHRDVAPGGGVVQPEEKVLGVDRCVTAVRGGLGGDDGGPGAWE